MCISPMKDRVYIVPILATHETHKYFSLLDDERPPNTQTIKRFVQIRSDVGEPGDTAAGNTPL